MGRERGRWLIIGCIAVFLVIEAVLFETSPGRMEMSREHLWS